MPSTLPPKYPVFVSYHTADKDYKDEFVKIMNGHITDVSVGDHSIDNRGKTLEEVSQLIRDRFIRRAKVTVVLIGRETWQRKHVDWEIHASLRDTPANRRCALLGIILPSNDNHHTKAFNKRLIPPRLAINLPPKKPYALIRPWNGNPNHMRTWIHKAFRQSKSVNPSTRSLDLYAKNRKGDPMRGWQ